MAVLLLVVWTLACTDTVCDVADSGSPSDTATDSTLDSAASGGPNFVNDVYDVYDENCAECHEDWGDRDESDVYDFLLTEEDGGFRLVVPGDRANSLLYSKVASEIPLDDKARMPVQTFLIESAELTGLAAWIDSGAADDEQWQQLQPNIWNRGHCKSCHDDWGTSRTDILDSLLTIKKNAYWLVDPGEAELSLLYLKLSSSDPPVGAQMPVQYDYLSADQIERIGLWIDAGAPPAE